MDIVQVTHRTEYPVSADLTSIPLEMLEMICHFLKAEDITCLSRVNSSMNASLSQGICGLGMAGIRKALSERRAADALTMLGDFCKWLGLASGPMSLDEKLQVWQCAQDFAGHACLSEEEQSLALRQVYFWACPSSESSPDEMLRLVQDIRAKWFCKFFPWGTVFVKGNPCKSFKFVAQYLNDGPHPPGQEMGADSNSRPPKSAALLGARIEAIRLHDNLSEGATQFALVASKLSEVRGDIQPFFRVTLALDLIECIKQFAPESALQLLSHIDPLIESAEAEEKSAYLLAVHGVKVRFHRGAASDSEDCRLM